MEISQTCDNVTPDMSASKLCVYLYMILDMIIYIYNSMEHLRKYK